MKKKKTIYAAALALLAAASVYQLNIIRTGKIKDAYGILTPAMDDGESFPGGEQAGEEIFDAPVPLAPGGEISPYVDQVLMLVNVERGKAGLAPLEKSSQIGAAAAVRAKELASAFSHTRPDGSSYKTVLGQGGIAYLSCGENVAYGYRTPEEVMEGWMDSEGHRANILGEKYGSVGIGYFKDGSGQAYWAQLFVSPEIN